MYLIFGLSIVLGQLTFTIGSENHSMNLMLLGRIVFGFGGESINICQCSMIIKWFYKSQVALPLGLTITVARLGSVLNDVLSPRLSYVDNATPALWTGFFICILSFLTSILLCIVDWNKDINMGRGERENEENQASFGSLKEFSRLYWIITILCTCLYGAVMPFNYIASGFFTSTFLSHMNKVDAQNTAGLYMSIPFFVSAFLVPLYGFMIDRYGKRAYLSFVAAVTSLISFVVFYFFPPIFGLVLLGCTYSMFASVIWPAISLVVKPSLVV